ncbi:hypothetical protein [Thermococcus sp.]
MTEMSFRKQLFKAIKELKNELEELGRYGTPYLVGEIKKVNGKWEVHLAVSVIEEKIEEFSIEENETFMFICPVRDTRPYKVYMDVISLISNKRLQQEIKPGSVIKGNPRRALKRMGFEILWMHSQNTSEGTYITVWASKRGNRYTITMKVVGEETRIIEVKKI